MKELTPEGIEKQNEFEVDNEIFAQQNSKRRKNVNRFKYFRIQNGYYWCASNTWAYYSQFDFHSIRCKVDSMLCKILIIWTNSKCKGSISNFPIEKGKAWVFHDYEKTYGIKQGTFEASSLTDRDVSTIDFKGNFMTYDIEKGTPKFEVKVHDWMGDWIHGIGGKGPDYGALELVTGGSDGCVRVWNPRQEAPVVRLEQSESEEIKPDCWWVKFGNAYNTEERCIAAGYDNGDVKLFDLRMNMLQWDTNLSNGICCLEFDRPDIPMNKLVCTTLESKFHVFYMRTYHPEKGYSGLEEIAHKSTIWGISHYPQNRDLFTTLGGNGGIRLYKYKYPA